MDELNPSRRCSLFSRQRILLRGWLTELTDSEGSDNEMRDSEEDSGQKRSRTVKSEVVNSEPTINYYRGNLIHATFWCQEVVADLYTPHFVLDVVRFCSITGFKSASLSYNANLLWRCNKYLKYWLK
jgi:hypothetical protein